MYKDYNVLNTVATPGGEKNVMHGYKCQAVQHDMLLSVQNESISVYVFYTEGLTLYTCQYVIL